MNKFYTLAISAFAALALSSNAVATTHNYNFGAKLTGDGPASLNFASLSFNDLSHVFSLSVNNAFSAFGSNAFIGAMAVDYSLKKKETINISNVLGGVNHVNFTKGGGPTGIYDFRFDFGNSNQDRLAKNETVSWTSNNFDFSKLGTSPAPFALHVQGIGHGHEENDNDFNSHEFDDDEHEGLSSGWYIPSAVPEPSTYAMMVAGIGMIFVIARRRRV